MERGAHATATSSAANRLAPHRRPTPSRAAAAAKKRHGPRDRNLPRTVWTEFGRSGASRAAGTAARRAAAARRAPAAFGAFAARRAAVARRTPAAIRAATAQAEAGHAGDAGRDGFVKAGTGDC